jgi:hypothetical protein
MKCKNCWICKKSACEYYNNINTNDDVDPTTDFFGLGKKSFGNNKTKRSGGKRPEGPKGFF